MFIRLKADRRGRLRHQLVRSTRAGRHVGQYWATWDRAAKVDRAADRLERRLVRLRGTVKLSLGTTSVDDEVLDQGA